MDPVKLTREDDVAIITLDRADRRNALDVAAAAAVKAAIDGAQDARVVILTGAGRAFCAGGDLEELARWSDMPAEDIAQQLYGSFQAMIRSIRHSPSVVIAAVNGAAVGAGMDLALACDLRVAGESARFGQVWVGLGVIPGTGGAFLTQHLAGPTRAAEMLLTGEIIDARSAHDAGLVNHVVPDAELMQRTRSLAEKILRHPREGVIANKRAYVAASDAALQLALAHAREVQPGRFTSEEFKAEVAKRLTP